MSAYEEALRGIQLRGRFGIHLGLGRTRALLQAMGDPHSELRGVLIGGTNGKGSVQAMVAAILRAEGLRVGQTPKPHLQTYRERILVDGRPIAPADFATVVGETALAADSLPRRLGPPTEFELLTAAAFEWFHRSAVDVAVIEVGLGGRLDATNAWDGGVAAITTVALDHTEHLGATRELIGREKAGIIKRGDLAVSGVTGAGAGPIRARARRMGVPLTEVVPLPVLSMDHDGLRLLAPDLGSVRVGLLGRHQAANAAVALGVVAALDAAGIARVSDRAIRHGLATARWPGRLELLPRDASETGGARDAAAPDVLLDGAHNPEGASALAASVDELRPWLSPGRLTVLMAVVRDKDVAGIVSSLAASAAIREARIIATAVPDSTRSLDPNALADAWRAALPRAGARDIDADNADVAVEADADVALSDALAAAAREGGAVLVCGSLYLVGHVRARLVDDADLIDPPDAVSLDGGG